MVATATDLATTPYWSQPTSFARLISEALDWSTRNPDAAEPRLDAMARELPSGSGIDSGTTIARDLDGTAGLDTGVSFDQVFILESSWHAMDSNGYYAGWFDFRVIVESTFAGPTVAIVWADGKSPEQDYPCDCGSEDSDRDAGNDLAMAVDCDCEWDGVADPTDYLINVYSEAMREQHSRIEFDDPPA